MNPAADSYLRLSELAAGKRARVVTVDGPPDLRRRLAELGLLPGATVAVVRRAPFGCPLEFDVDGARYAVRRDTAAGVRLEALP
jgi:ferrous iron transport protein A